MAEGGLPAAADAAFLPRVRPHEQMFGLAGLRAAAPAPAPQQQGALFTLAAVADAAAAGPRMPPRRKSKRRRTDAGTADESEDTGTRCATFLPFALAREVCKPDLPHLRPRARRKQTKKVVVVVVVGSLARARARAPRGRRAS